MPCVASEVSKAQNGKSNELIDWGPRPHWLGRQHWKQNHKCVSDSEKFVKWCTGNTASLEREAETRARELGVDGNIAKQRSLDMSKC